MGTFREKGWEFWLGAAFVASAVAAIVSALWIEEWRDVVRDLGPSVAALAVVGASLIAYSGAIAKVRFDRHSEDARARSAARNVLLKTHIAAAQLFEESGDVTNRLRTDIDDGRRATTVSEYRIAEPEGLIEAWNHLDQLPDDCPAALRGIRLRLGRIGYALEDFQRASLAESPRPVRSLQRVVDLYARVTLDAEKIVRTTQLLLDRNRGIDPSA